MFALCITVVISVQVLSVLGQSNLVNVTPGEYYLDLSWIETENDINLTLRVGLSNSFNLTTLDTSGIPQGPGIKTYTIGDLHPGRLYQIDLRRNGNVFFSNTQATKPLPPIGITVKTPGVDHLEMQWYPHIDSQQDSYQVFVTGVTNYSEVYQSAVLTATTYDITNLQPGHKYTITVVAISYNESSNFTSHVTENTVPRQPYIQYIRALDNTSIMVTWNTDIDSVQDGVLLTATHNNTLGVLEEVDLYCNYTLFHNTCIIKSIPGAPGDPLLIKAYAVTEQRRSTPDMLYYSTKPNPLSDIIEDSSSTSSLQLTLIPQTASSYLQYRILSYNDNGYLENNVTLSATQRKVDLQNLTAGTTYNVTVTVLSDYEDSELYSEVFYTYPNPPGAIQIVDADIQHNSLELTWQPVSSGSLEYYQVMIFPKEKGTISPVLDYTIDKRRALFDNLEPGRRYNISVQAGIDKKKSSAVFGITNTRPHRPENLTYIIRSGREVDIYWAVPYVGVLEKYIVTLSSESHNLSQWEVPWTETTFKLERLHPGDSYTITLAAKSGQVTGPEAKVMLSTPSSSNANIYIDDIGTTYINISWSKPEAVSFDTYIISISPPDSASPVSFPESSTNLHHSFTGLHPGTAYNLSLQTVDNGTANDDDFLPVLTDPLAVLELNVSSHDSSSLIVVWTVANSLQQTQFEIVSESELAADNRTWPDIMVTDGVTEYQQSLQGLFSGHMYNVWVRAVKVQDNLTSYSSWKSANKTTKPKPVTNLQYVVDGYNIQLSWEPDPDSIQDQYFIWYRGTLIGHGFGWEQITVSTQTSDTLTNLFPGEQYEILVFAFSNGAMSQSQKVNVQIPPLPVSGFEVIDPVTTTHSFMIMWTYDKNATYVEGYKLTYKSYNSAQSTSLTLGNPNDTNTRTFDNLTSGETYLVTMISFVGNVSSAKRELNVTLRPECLTVLSEGVNSTSAIEVSYTAAENYFDHYLFTLVNSSIHQQPIQKNKDDPDRNVLFNNLEGGTTYQVEVVSVSGGQVSDPQQITVQTVPNTPHVSQESLSTEIILTIHRPAGNVDNYGASCFFDKQSCGNHVVQATGNTQQIVFDQLEPYTTYRFLVMAVAGYKQNSIFLDVTTNQSAPSSVRDLKVEEVEELTVNLTWKVPRILNGVLTAFVVSYSSDTDGPIDNGAQTMPLLGSDVFKEEFNMMLPQLLAGRTYTFVVRARTVSLGASATSTITMKTYSPLLKVGLTADQAAPKKLATGSSLVTSSTIVINFTNAFSTIYGPIINYTVIVTTDNSNNYSTSPSLPGWNAAQRDGTIKAYQAVGNCSSFFQDGSTCSNSFRLHRRSAETNYKAFEIGSESDCEGKVFCNGPLKPNTKYYFKLRAYTKGGFSDTSYSEPIVTAVKPTEDTSNPVPGIVGGIIAGILVVLIVIVVVLYLRRRLRERSTMYKGSNHVNMTPRSSVRRSRKSHPVNIAEFRQHVNAMSADSDFKYAEEFEDLKDIGREQACSAAELPVNRGKNRFTNILPYDHSRVKLLPTDDEEGSDYINANYMPGHTSKREYIVTQGPLPGTRDDYWRMLWEQNCRNIVMLTKCVEKGREKCDHYWPSGTDAMFYSDLQVAALNETKFPAWTITEFKMSLGDISRQIRHFHFTAWPDFGVPDKPQTLVRFVRTVRDKLMRECGPIVVHCSAGVGRSGTYIVLDRLLQTIKDQSQIDIYQTVSEMRKERVWMVQTEQQYICIHQCLLCVLEGREDEHVYENAAFANAAFEAHDKDDEGINIDIP